MRRKQDSSEIVRLIAPVGRIVDAAWRRIHWWIGAMVVLYLLSGITIVRPEETALILRWGRVVGDTPALQQHNSGLLFAFPRPIDQVIRVPTHRVSEVRVHTLAPGGSAPPPASDEEDEQQPTGSSNTLDPITEGYALTGDQNVVQLDAVVHYRVADPALWQFYGPNVDDVIRAEVTSALVRSLGEMGVDRVLSDGRKDLVATASRRVIEGLAAARSGLELTSLELTTLSPPAALASDFAAVQSAFIGAETKKKDAQAFAESAVPQANADVDKALQDARAEAASNLATARGEAGAFIALAKEYRANPTVARERLYRDMADKVLSAAKVQWVPPPGAGGYRGLRVQIQSTGAGSGPASVTNPGFP